MCNKGQTTFLCPNILFFFPSRKSIWDSQILKPKNFIKLDLEIPINPLWGWQEGPSPSLGKPHSWRSLKLPVVLVLLFQSGLTGLGWDFASTSTQEISAKASIMPSRARLNQQGSQ